MSIEINIKQDFTAANLVSKIKEMRIKLAETYTRQRPVLPTVLSDDKPDDIKKITWFDVILDDGRNKIRLRIRRDKLYFQGFRVNDANNWFELGVSGKDKPLIDPNSTLLGYGHNYNNLLVAAGFSATAGLTAVTVGRQKLMSVVDWLATPPTTSAAAKKRAEALLIVVVTFCESARFVPVLEYLRRTWQQSLNVPGWIDKLVHRWEKLSGCVLFYDAHPTHTWVPQKLEVEGPPPKYEPKEVEAKTVDELLEYLGILQRDPETMQPPKP